jgi:hypothetical protein
MLGKQLVRATILPALSCRAVVSVIWSTTSLKTFLTKQSLEFLNAS